MQLNKVVRSTFIIFLAALFSTSTHAQWASIQGVVTDYETSEKLEGANVTIQQIDNENRFKGVPTDRNGFYQLSSIRSGIYEFKVSFLGYETYVDTLRFQLGDVKTLSVSLKVDANLLGEVVVEQQAGSVLREEGRQRVSPIDLSRIPTPVVGGDLVSYLQTLPGVVSLGSRGGRYLFEVARHQKIWC